VAARLTWLGHSTVVVELDGVRLVTDPVLRRRVAHLRRDVPAVTPGRPDAVLLSHLHYDHLDKASLGRLGRDVPIVAPPGTRYLLRGFSDVREVTPGSSVLFGSVGVDVVDALHDGRRRPIGPPIPALGYVVRGSRSVYFAGDTELFDEMAAVGPVDVALVPVAGWGAKLGPGHLDPPSAARALTLLRPSVAVPIHWGTYGVIGRPRGHRAPAEEFAAEAAVVAPDVDVRILSVGETLDLSLPGSAGR
jgi:L-ascorbate metabolism protein UlaG (beta-lactamase superfamily)